jgi:hypothetical protein
MVEGCPPPDEAHMNLGAATGTTRAAQAIIES